jgi:hypothetical protein
MTRFLVSTVSDIRGGRQSWRVILTLSLPAFVAAVLLSQLHF